MTTLLLIDDDLVLAELLRAYLKDHGFTLESVAHPSKAIERIASLSPQLIILDVMMPDTDGFTLIKEIRRTKSVPVIMLTARGESFDRILGLELGADDYLTKPFEPRELVARIKAILKRAGRAADDRVVSGDISIDPASRTVVIAGKTVEFTSMEYDLLLLFASNPGRKFTREELLSQLHETEVEAFGRAIDNLVAKVRKKIEKHTKQESIRTIWGTGYMFVEPGRAE